VNDNVTAVNDVIERWSDRVRKAAASKTALRLAGGGSKDFYGQELAGERFDTTEYAGVVDYDPTEMVITARCGTPLAEVESALREKGQMLAFEPPAFGLAATLGGCIACGLSGPRRAYAGAVRDDMLGVRVLDGYGNALAFGGRVMKNVAGFDVSRLVAGSLGTLGVILEASLKCVPMPKSEATRIFELGADQAVQRVNEWGGQPLPLSASCYHQGRLFVRLSGARSAVDAATRRLGGAALADGEAFWSSVREQTHDFFARRDVEAPLWRISVQSTAPYADLGGEQLLEWGGALRWLKSPVRLADASRAQAEAARLREWAQRHGGHATLFRSVDKAIGVFQPLAAPAMTLHRRLKSAFDPTGIFNPGRLYPGL
jgi:glycolate oxidase FAD binding subunit